MIFPALKFRACLIGGKKGGVCLRDGKKKEGKKAGVYQRFSKKTNFKTGR